MNVGQIGQQMKRGINNPDNESDPKTDDSDHSRTSAQFLLKHGRGCGHTKSPTHKMVSGFVPEGVVLNVGETTAGFLRECERLKDNCPDEV